MPAVSAQNLEKAFGPQVVLNGASLSLARGEKVGLIGANGTGKSTFAKIIAGLEAPDAGTVSFRRGLSVTYLSQEPVLDPDLSARATVEQGLAAWHAALARHGALSKQITDGDADDDAISEMAELGETVERLGGWDRGHVVDDVLDRLGVQEPERPVGERSGGERRRIALAQLLVQRPDIAILDEPTNHLDIETAQWLEEHLAREFPGAILLVTHDRYFLEAIVTRIVELDRGKLQSYDGNYSDYLAKKADRLEHEDRAERNRQNILRRERDWLSRGPAARTTKQKARIHRAEALEAETPANAGRGAKVELTAQVTRTGKTILELRGVVLAAGERTLTEPIDLFVAAGERIGIVGPNGVGKTTLLRAILDQQKPQRGEAVVGKNTRIAYLDQAREDLDDDKSIYDDVRGEHGSTVVKIGEETINLGTWLENFLFDPSKQRQKVASLSGGERARVALAKMLRSGSNLLLFDEPTNDLDLPTLSSLEEMLIEWPGSAIVVTHDRAFLDRVATSTLAFERGPDGIARVEKHGGGWSDYVAHKAELRATAAVEVATARAKAASEAPKKKKGLSWNEQKELDGLLEKIDEAEAAVKRLEAQLADPTLYVARPGDGRVPLTKELTKELEAARAEVAKRLARWEALEAKR